MTRRGPNSANNPSVTRNTPPRAPTSSPSRKTRGSAASASRRPSRIASSSVSSATGPPCWGARRAGRAGAANAAVARARLREEMREQVFGWRVGRLLRGESRRGHLLAGGRPQGRVVRLGPEAKLGQARAEASDRLALLPRRDLGGVAVQTIVVVAGVRQQPV